MTARTAEARAVERANQAFYDAIENSDLDGLEKIVLSGPLAESVTTVHPGWPALRGRGEVMRSYALIMANTDYIQFFLTDVEVAVDGDAALVTCTENILTGGPAEDDGSAGSLVGGLVVATNVFRRSGGSWQLWAHHGSPVLAEEDPEESDEPEAGEDPPGGTAVGDLDDLGDLDGLDTIEDLKDIAGIDDISGIVGGGGKPDGDDGHDDDADGDGSHDTGHGGHADGDDSHDGEDDDGSDGSDGQDDSGSDDDEDGDGPEGTSGRARE